MPPWVYNQTMILDKEQQDFFDQLYQGGHPTKGTAEVSYLLITGRPGWDTTDSINRYLPHLSALTPVYENEPVWVAVVQHVAQQWCVDRLGSGAIGARVCDSLRAAHIQGADEVWRLRK